MPNIVAASCHFRSTHCLPSPACYTWMLHLQLRRHDQPPRGSPRCMLRNAWPVGTGRTGSLPRLRTIRPHECRKLLPDEAQPNVRPVCRSAVADGGGVLMSVLGPVLLSSLRCKRRCLRRSRRWMLPTRRGEFNCNLAVQGRSPSISACAVSSCVLQQCGPDDLAERSASVQKDTDPGTDQALYDARMHTEACLVMGRGAVVESGSPTPF